MNTKPFFLKKMWLTSTNFACSMPQTGMANYYFFYVYIWRKSRGVNNSSEQLRDGTCRCRSCPFPHHFLLFLQQVPPSPTSLWKQPLLIILSSIACVSLIACVIFRGYYKESHKKVLSKH